VATTVRIIIYKPVVDAYRGWGGPIGRSTMRLARETRFRQIAMANKKTGKMASTITVGNRTRWARGIEVKVGANAGQRRGGLIGYAVYNDQGTRPHIIVPKKPGGMLVFYWAKVGSVVRMRGVFHPGNRAYHWAERGLRAAMAQWSRGG